MIFFLTLCMTVCFSCFLLTLFVGLVLASGLAGIVGKLATTARCRASAAILFAVQVLPVCFAAVVTFGWMLPSFIVLEPRNTTESPGFHLWLMTGLSAALLFIFAWRCGHLVYETNRASKQWLRSATQLFPKTSVPTYRIQGEAPLVAVIGIFRPRIFVSQGVLSLFTTQELTAALAHEMAHVHAWDNLKRFVLRVIRLPRWIAPLAGLESTWASAAECDADENAVRVGAAPLELASALVKVGRLTGVSSWERSILACHLVAEPGSSSVTMRVHLLRHLLSSRELPREGMNSSIPVIVGLIIAADYGFLIPIALPVGHRIIELLVR
jgi:Zn-dependent protease with chaperone function